MNFVETEGICIIDLGWTDAPDRPWGRRPSSLASQRSESAEAPSPR